MLQQEVMDDVQAWQEEHIQALMRNLQEIRIQAQQQQIQPLNNEENMDVNHRPHQQIQPMGMDDAVIYVNAVKQTFNDRPQIYKEFLDIMYQFQRQIIDMPSVLRRIMLIFDGYPELINGFQEFVPGLAMPKIEYVQQEQCVDDLAMDIQDSLHIEQVIAKPAPIHKNVAIVKAMPRQRLQISQSKIEEGLNYFDIVKSTFTEKPQVFEEFLNTMRDFKNRRIDHRGLSRKIVQIFDGHPRLIFGFQTFLQPETIMSLSQNYY